jgi:hypothetical protein
MYLRQLKDISEAVETGYFDVAARMLRNLIKEIKESNEQHEWVGLTKAEFEEAIDGLEDLEDCWHAIEAKLKEKNCPSAD